MSPDDDALVRAAQAGDRDALDRLLRTRVDAIHALCRRLCGNGADAEDATQEALIAIVTGEILTRPSRKARLQRLQVLRQIRNLLSGQSQPLPGVIGLRNVLQRCS